MVDAVPTGPRNRTSGCAIVVVILIALVGVSIFSGKSDGLDAQSRDACEHGQSEVQKRLVDPDSAHFLEECSSSTVARQDDGTWRTTGRVMSNSGFGFVLKQQYVVVIRYGNPNDPDDTYWRLVSLSFDGKPFDLYAP
jgi:hypothetical protein